MAGDLLSASIEGLEDDHPPTFEGRPIGFEGHSDRIVCLKGDEPLRNLNRVALVIQEGLAGIRVHENAPEFVIASGHQSLVRYDIDDSRSVLG